jgi:hypothetical protein
MAMVFEHDLDSTIETVAATRITAATTRLRSGSDAGSDESGALKTRENVVRTCRRESPTMRATTRG